MTEYYRLKLLRKTEQSTSWDEIYLEINEKKSEVIEYISKQAKPLKCKLEKISEEDVVEILHNANWFGDGKV